MEWNVAGLSGDSEKPLISAPIPSPIHQSNAGDHAALCKRVIEQHRPQQRQQSRGCALPCQGVGGTLGGRAANE